MNRIKRFEALFLTKVYKALNSQVLSFIRDYKKYGAIYAKNSIGQNNKIGKVIAQMYRYITPLEARIVYGDLKKRYPSNIKRASMGVSVQWSEDVKRYLDRYLLSKAVIPISEKTKEIILKVLKEGIDEGWGVERIVRELMENQEIKNRARKIVRTESVRAANIGYMIGAYDSEWEQVKTWVSVNDSRTRRTHTHYGVGGEKKGLMQPFSNGLMFPGDPNAPAKETINCRCRLTFRIKRDEKGNPIRRPLRRYGIRNSIIDILFFGFVQGLTQSMINDLMSEP